jgi:hypothetical protein
MKVTVLSESPADEAAVRILVDGLLGGPTESIPPPPLRTRGWSSVLSILPIAIKHLYYRTDVDALVIVVDSDDSSPHRQEHELPDGANDKCRLSQLRAVSLMTLGQLRELPNRSRLKTAIGLAIPALEAWYRFGIDPHAIEADLIRRPNAGTRDLRNQLKKDVYGTERPGREMSVARATEEATRLVQILDEFERLFPDGFGPLVRDIRSW